MFEEKKRKPYLTVKLIFFHLILLLSAPFAFCSPLSQWMRVVKVDPASDSTSSSSIINCFKSIS